MAAASLLNPHAHVIGGVRGESGFCVGVAQPAGGARDRYLVGDDRGLVVNGERIGRANEDHEVRLDASKGGALDVFGKTAHRRMERELIDEYRGMIARALETPIAGDTAADARAVEIAELPDIIRGYENLKENNVERFRSRAAELGA